MRECEENLARAHRNLALADAEFLNGIQQTIRQLKTEQSRLDEELHTVARPSKAIEKEVSATISAMCDSFRQLEELLKAGEGVELRNALLDTVSQIDIKTERFKGTGGHLNHRLSETDIHLSDGTHFPVSLIPKRANPISAC